MADSLRNNLLASLAGCVLSKVGQEKRTEGRREIQPQLKQKIHASVKAI